MRLFERAMELKKVSEQYYRNLANKCAKSEGVKRILTDLANEEMKHFSLFQLMNNEQLIEIESNDYLEIMGQEILSLQKKNEDLTCCVDQMELYDEALELEKKHLQFFKDILKKDESSYKRVISMIISDEEKHIELLENLIELIHHPDNWVENAEFNIKEEF